MALYYDILHTPLGVISITANDNHIVSVLYDTEEPTTRPNRLTDMCKIQLDEYFSGSRTAFTIPFTLQGTAFQQQAWQTLLNIPYGQTMSYAQQAQNMDNPKATQAVGGANGRNVINIIIPCHRVIGANGSLTGYGGGIERKQWLLEHERQVGLRCG